MPAYMINGLRGETLKDLTGFLAETVSTAFAQRQTRLDRYDRADKLLTGQRGEKLFPFKDASNIVTPVTQIRVQKLAEQAFDALFGTHPVAKMTAITGRDPETQQDWHKTAKEATDWFDYAARQPHELDTENAITPSIWDYFKYGLGVWKVVYFEDKQKGGFLTPDGEWEPDPEPRQVYRGPRYFYVSPRDLIWPEGYGTAVDTIPWIGQLRMYTPHTLNLKAHESNREYDPVAVKKVLEGSQGAEAQPSLYLNDDVRPGEHQKHRQIQIVEIWLRYDIDGDGIDEELVCDWHQETATILRLVYCPYRFRPFFVARLAQRSGTSFDSIGIPEIMRPVQDQIDALHNLTIEAGKVATRSIIVGRQGSALGDFLADEKNEMLPGLATVTENPEADIAVHQLGQPGPAMQALQLIEYMTQYMTELVGVGSAQLGDVGLARRSSAYGVDALLTQGATFTRGAMRRFAAPFIRSIMMAFEVYRVHGSEGRVYRVLGDDGMWVERLFTFAEPLYEKWAVTATIADPENSPDAAVQRNMVLAQFMLAWLEKIGQAVATITNPALPDSARLGLAEIAKVSEEVVRRVIENARDMQDVSALLPGLERLLPAVVQMAQQEKMALMQQQQQMMQRQAEAEQGVREDEAARHRDEMTIRGMEMMAGMARGGSRGA